jgi:hypothetical protein
MASWREVAAWRRSASAYCCERWSVFAPLSCGTLVALGAGSALVTDDWGATAIFGGFSTAFVVVGVRNIFTTNS